jgi:2-oxoglutarate dehydrogenase E1 component
MVHVTKKYEEQLIKEGILNLDRLNEVKNKIKNELEKAYEASKTHKFSLENWSTKEWEELKVSTKFGKVKDTGIDIKTLQSIGDKITSLPDDWDFHPQVKKIYEARRKAISEGKGIDWGTAEALAFATLIDEGFHVRLSG